MKEEEGRSVNTDIQRMSYLALQTTCYLLPSPLRSPLWLPRSLSWRRCGHHCTLLLGVICLNTPSRLISCLKMRRDFGLPYMKS